jgi:hypothetical protein
MYKISSSSFFTCVCSFRLQILVYPSVVLVLGFRNNHEKDICFMDKFDLGGEELGEILL